MNKLNRHLLLLGNTSHVHQTGRIRSGNKLSACSHVALDLLLAHTGRNGRLLDREHTAESAALILALRLVDGNVGIYLGRMLAKKGLGIQFFDGIDAIIPIPLTRKREKERGYNQSLLIAKGIQQLTHLTIIKDAVRRKKFSESQTHKNRQERLENVSQVFEAAATYHDGQGEHPITQLEGKHILIIDDVCTTGATIISCAETLIKAAGKMKISVLTVGFAHD